MVFSKHSTIQILIFVALIVLIFVELTRYDSEIDAIDNRSVIVDIPDCQLVFEKQDSSGLDYSTINHQAVVDAIQTPKIVSTSNRDTLQINEPQSEVFYYTNGKISLRKNPWENGRRIWVLYDLYGMETIRLEEVRLSYTVSYEARFHENGAVSVIHFSENPGAANFWFEGEMEFGTMNEPITRRVRKMPYESLEEMNRRAWQYWDKSSGTWKEQEVMDGGLIKDGY